jgi:hypothetical protein
MNLAKNVEASKLGDLFGTFANMKYYLDGGKKDYITAQQIFDNEVLLDFVDFEMKKKWYGSQLNVVFNVRSVNEPDLPARTLTLSEGKFSRLQGAYGSATTYRLRTAKCAVIATPKEDMVAHNYRMIQKVEEMIVQARFG